MREILAPSEFQNMQGYKKEWKRYGAKCYWTAERISYIIKDEGYTGTMVSLKTTALTVRGKRIKVPSSEWIRVENTHEPIVSYELFVKANSMVKQIEFRKSGRKEKNIYFCGYCGRQMQRDSMGGLRCNQRYLIKECSCRKVTIKRKEANEAVLCALREQIGIFIKEAELSQNERNRTAPYSEAAEIKTLLKTISTMKKTWMPLYEQYMDGKLSREDFLVEKKKHDKETVRLESRLKELQSRQDLQLERKQQESKNVSRLRSYAEQMELTEEIKEKLIDKVNVYSDNRIEICWKFESGFSDTNTMNKQHQDMTCVRNKKSLNFFSPYLTE